MSPLWLVIILVLPVIVIVILLNRKHTKQLQKIEKRNSVYLQQVLQQTGVVISFQQDLVYQRVLLDEVNGKLLVISHIDNTYSYKLLELDDIKNLEVQHVRHVVEREAKDKKPETITSKIGLQIVSDDGTSSRHLLVFYDHLHHNVLLMSDMEKEAVQLKQKIQEAITKKTAVS